MLKFKEFLNEEVSSEYNLVESFFEHYYKGVEFNMDILPEHLINKFPHYKNDKIYYVDNINDYIYAGAEKFKSITNIKSWTLDEETAEAFSQKYKNGTVYKMKDEDFIKNFHFISMDILHNYLTENVSNVKLNSYVSESEIYVLKKI
jgi:hypothetical protein